MVANLIITLCFIILAIISILKGEDCSYLIPVEIIVLIVLFFLINNRYLNLHQRLNRVEKIREINVALILSYIFLIISMILIAILSFLSKSMTNNQIKVVACLLCIAIFLLLFSGYIFECQQFGNSESLTKVRSLGLAINPKSLLGKCIYGFTFTVIIVSFVLILVYGPNN